MKVAVTADIQIDERSRFDETVRLLDWVVGDAFNRGVDAWVDCGDIFERRSTQRERDAIADFVQSVTDRVPMVIVAGNHEATGEVVAMNRLRTKHPIIAYDRPGVVTLDGLDVACLPWPSKSALLAWAGDVSIEEGGRIAGDLLRDVLRGLAAQRRDGVPCLFAGHAMIRGAKTSTGQPLVGCDMEIGAEDLALARADVYALGHVHKGQDISSFGSPAFYVGSLRRRDYGEIEDKRYAIVEFGDGVDPVVESIKIPATPLVLLESRWTGENFAWDDAAQSEMPPGADIRFRYDVDADQRDAARRLAADLRSGWLDMGAVSVKVEEQVRPTVRARAPEIAEAVGVADKLRAYWTSTGAELTDARKNRLIERLRDLELEVGCE